jgi:hypothetical protein
VGFPLLFGFGFVVGASSLDSWLSVSLKTVAAGIVLYHIIINYKITLSIYVYLLPFLAGALLIISVLIVVGVNAVLAYPLLVLAFLHQVGLAVRVYAVLVALVAEVHQVVVAVAAALPAGRHNRCEVHLLHSRFACEHAEDGVGAEVADGAEVGGCFPVVNAIIAKGVRAIEDVPAGLEVLIEANEANIAVVVGSRVIAGVWGWSLL